MWQTDFTYFRIKGWGDYYLSTILDDFSRYIVHWELCTSMKHGDVIRNVDTAIEKAQLKTKIKPKLLSDNGSCYISKELGKYLTEELKMKQVHGRPAHPQTQGKIERYHRIMKNVVKLNNYYSPEELKEALEEFVDRYNNLRYHEALNNLTPADIYYGRGQLILKQREHLKKIAINTSDTLQKREFVNMVFDSNLYYENGIYRTPTMLGLLSHNHLKMKEKGLLIYEKKEGLLDEDPLSGE